MDRRTFLLSSGAAGAAALALLPGRARAQGAATAAITGAGATFPAPVYAKWGEAAARAINVQLNYQAVGSGGGQNQIRNRTVDFGASDAPMGGDDLAQANLLQFPTVVGSVVPIVNLPGIAVDQLRLTGPLLAEIYAGTVTKWNDPKVAEANPGLALPNLAVAPAYRADGSGTTFVFTSYLGAVSPEWKAKVGANTSVRWPVGTGARGNDGVAGTVRNVRGAIGYVENAFATQNHLTTVQLRNKSGAFVKPEAASFLSAAGNADWSAPNFAANLIDTGGAASWPIASPTFVLLPKDPKDTVRAQNVMRFFDWAYTSGKQLATDLEYIPLPDGVAAQVRAAWAALKDGNGKALWPAG